MRESVQHFDHCGGYMKIKLFLCARKAPNFSENVHLDLLLLNPEIEQFTISLFS